MDKPESDDTSDGVRRKGTQSNKSETRGSRYRSISPWKRSSLSSSPSRKRRHHSRERDKYRHKYESSRSYYDRKRNEEDTTYRRRLEDVSHQDESFGQDGSRRDDGKYNSEIPGKIKLSVTSKLDVELKLPQQDKKKKLWSKTDSSLSVATWKSASFSDEKLTAKFQRLMGMKENALNAKEVNNSNTQHQELLFKRMEEDYEVARQTTHTLRGAGLGFSK